MTFNLFAFLRRKSSEVVARLASRGIGSLATVTREQAEIDALWAPASLSSPRRLLMAAQSGWFPTHQPAAGFPDEETRNAYLARHLERRPYRIRLARADDLQALLRLESACWSVGLRMPAATLAHRVKAYPQGQLVLEQEHGVVGVIYSQRIARLQLLDGVPASSVDALHDAQAPLAQLLAVNILPDVQQQQLGDQLLEFMLTYQSLQADVQAVVAITRCKYFDPADMPLSEYIHLRNAQGVLADPFLRFHELHGARIERVMPGYRPLDSHNGGAGVLVSYDIRQRCRRDMPVVDPRMRARVWSSREILAEVDTAVRQALGPARAKAFAEDRPLMEMGLDSADLLGLNERLTHYFALALALTPAFFFEHNTVAKMVAALARQLRGTAAIDAAAVEPASQAPSADSDASAEDIAIIGMACRLPGGIDTPEALWACLQMGTSVIGSLPAGRWEWPTDIDPAQQHQGIERGGFLDDIAGFDAAFFRISAAEAESMDPQQRILLELAWSAIERAGYAPAAWSGSPTGVFIGASGSDYARLQGQSGIALDAHYGTGSSLAILANRLSYFYDFNGPSLLIDTACSSSLVALHQAVQSIRSGESAQALVGGINLMVHPASSVAYYKAGMLSRDGACRTFDAAANGYVRSEGAVMLLLKPLTAAERDRDHIHAVIKGTASNHGGQASGLTVPNPAQQARLLESAWRAARIDPRDLGYLETHGTGTVLGDPLEVQGIRQAFAAILPDGMPASCGLGSVKTNLGHLEAAAGVAGLLKVVLCLQHRQLPANVHFTRLNPHIALDGSGLYVVEQLRDWVAAPGAGARLAGVSSFGSGGANAHAVVAEYTAPRQPPAERHPALANDPPHLFVLSARSLSQLRRYAQDYAEWLATAGQSVTLADLAWLLQQGRKAMPQRLALVASERQQLIAAWQDFADRASPAIASAAAPMHDKDASDAGLMRTLLAHKDWVQLAQRWQAGAEIDWALPTGEAEIGLPAQPQRFAAPTYPFARQRYWLPGSADWQSAAPPAAVAPSLLPAVQPPLASAPRAAWFVPRWQLLRAGENDGVLWPQPGQRVLIIGASADEQPSLLALYPYARLGEIQCDTSDAALLAMLGEPDGQAAFDHILWLAPADHAAALEDLPGSQENGVLFLFKLIKALVASGYAARALGWTVLTRASQAVLHNDRVAPAHAGVHGLSGAMAREFPHWTIRALDLELASAAGASDPWPQLLRLRALADGEVLAARAGQWFRRRLIRLALPQQPQAAEMYRQGGVYVVIGGAGGIGQAWTRYVVRRYAAQVIWIGRRGLDAAIATAQDAVAELGPRPRYLALDAVDWAELQAAYTQIRQHYGAVHGVIQAAAGPFDLSLAEMTETHFREVLAAKIDISVNLARVFSAEPLDFMLYFSSVVALEKNGGLSGYAAGGAFEDALALHLAARLPYAVKVINWGHWAIGTGARIAESAKARLRYSGGAPIEPDDAMEALQQLLGTPLRQAALLKTSRPDLVALIDAGQTLQVLPEAMGPSLISGLQQAAQTWPQDVSALRAASLFRHAGMEEALWPLFAGLLANVERGLGNLAVGGFYQRWLASSKSMLAQRGLLQEQAVVTPETLWQQWGNLKRQHFNHPDLQVGLSLLELCLRALPEVLAGSVRAIDLLFPGASMQRVEGIYRANASADYFNHMLGETVVAALAARLADDPQTPLRILEIGAGTGSTTAMLLPLLESYRQHIAEYAYTDISKAFLFQAEEHFVPAYPYVAPRLFDVELPLAGQGMASGHYDLVIATNVLHATRNIRNTLSNVKATMRTGGLLLLNEISTKSLFAHLTFGLLEGWWLSEDQVLRIADAPVLAPEAWREVLQQEGFSRVLLPLPQAQVLGQQIIVAESDGIVCQLVPARPATPSLPQQQALATALPAMSSVPVADIGGQLSLAALKEASNAQLRRIVARTLRMDSAEINAYESLASYGIDSILIVQLTNALREVFPDVSSTLLFECQTVNALSEYFMEHALPALCALSGIPASSATAGETPPAPQPASAVLAGGASQADDRIAIIGMSCRFPQARNVEEYWQLLASGGNAIGEVPVQRWALEDFFEADPELAVAQGKSYSKWGGFLEGVTHFDPLFFNISPREAMAIDPQERLFLQAAWEALEDAGYTRERLADQCGQQLGVFAGITRTGFDLFGPDLWQQGSTVYPHTSFSSVANRVSYFLNARGPSMPVDTMCSSSLTAVHQACQSLRSGECRVALAGGVNVYLHPSGYIGLSALGMLSRDGLCRSFGKGGNGFVPGEGVGMVLLKPLAQALADGDQIHAVIRATHVNHGGKTNGYTVPNPLAQAELVRQALDKAGVNARAVSYVEAHGTGTELGDPIEVAGLTQAFRHDTQECGYCALGSAKSNIGHLEAASGIAGLIKVVLQMQHAKLAPSLHAGELNPKIEFGRTPFVLQQTLADWPQPLLDQVGADQPVPQPRIAGVSSFGAGGSNAHVILQEYAVEPPAWAEPEQDCLILLSASSEERLHVVLARLHAFLTGRIDAGRPPRLADLAYTLQVGREHMDVRLALVIRTLPQLQQALQACLAGKAAQAGAYQGQSRQHKEVFGAFAGDDAMQQTLVSWFARGQYERLLGLWSKGLGIDWEALRRSVPGRGTPRRISLPTYPFEETPYWLPLAAPASQPRLTPVAAPAVPAAGAPIATPAPLTPLPQVFPAVTAKPAAIALQACAQVSGLFPLSTLPLQRPRHALVPLPEIARAWTAVGPATAEPRLAAQHDARIDLHELAPGLFRIDAGQCGISVATASAASALQACMEQLAATAPDLAPKVLLLQGLDHLFPAIGVQHAKDLAGAAAALVACPFPVIAVLKGTAGADAMLLAAACDLILCSLDGHYSLAAADWPAPALAWLAERLGPDCLPALQNGMQDGSALAACGWRTPCGSAASIEDHAQRSASAMAGIASLPLRELKRHLNRSWIPLIAALGEGRNDAVMAAVPVALPERLPVGFAWPAADDVVAPLSAPPQAVPLPSSVVSLHEYGDGVVLLSLHDRASKNTFSPEFVSGVIAAFQYIATRTHYKVVVMTGYDSYFACGGTRAGLLAIQNGSARFTDEQSYSLPLLCEIPVIAAMQGHAIGAGWTMGMFCDWTVYSEESVYQSPYMRYGFTPGAGSTLIFPYRLGADLSRDILMSAREFPGSELKQQGIGMLVLPRRQVLGHAMALARHLAQSERAQLVQDKRQRSQWLRQQLPLTFSQELALHDKTFVGNSDVIAGIERHFHREVSVAPVMATAAAAAAPMSPQQVFDSLQQGLMDELQLLDAQVDPDRAFIDMGMDSIAAVTWARKINQQFGLTLAATRLYSHPTLRRFTELVLDSIEEAASVTPAPIHLAATAVRAEVPDQTALYAWLRDTLAGELLLRPEQLDDEMKFIDMGLDSITAVTWIRAINRHYGLDIGATRVYSYPTLRQFGSYVWSLLEQVGGPVRPAASAAAMAAPKLVASFVLDIAHAGPEQSTSNQSAPKPTTAAAVTEAAMPAIAIIGMAGQFPQAANVGQFWDNLMQGRDCVSEIPSQRWSIDAFYDPDRKAPGKTVCRSMGALDNVDVFDPLFFNIAPAEAELMDPQQRLFLQNSWRCIEDAGYNPTDLSGSLCGVFVGCAASDYGQLMALPQDNAQALMGESVALLPARIAYFLNLQGPCLAIDTACSSSLVALASACDSLALGHSEVALAGGVYVINGPQIHVKMSQAGMLSPDGRCFSFDQRANGFVPGEGVGVLMLKRLDHAERDGDDIYGVLRAWGVNQDGRTNGITAPNPEAQTRLETSIYRKFDINPEHIGLLEAHGTGTKLGDPIEVDALCSAFQQFTSQAGFCALGSAKSNVGHLATAAGVTGVIKACLALRHRQLPPTIHYQALNEHISLDGSPFFINTSAAAWPQPPGRARLAAVSSFGFSGTNAHVVLSEAPQQDALDSRSSVAPLPFMLPVSARSQEQLQQYARDLVEFLEDEIDLAGVAYTFQTGRAVLHHRLLVMGDTRQELRQHLQHFADGGAGHARCLCDAVGVQAAQADAAADPALALALQWLGGGAVDWDALYANQRPQRRHGLPTYPFAREHYWIPQPEPVAEPQPAPQLPPRQATSSLAMPVTDVSPHWCDSALPSVPWQERLRDVLAGRVLVAYQHEAQRAAFTSLLAQLQKAAGLSAEMSPAYGQLQQIGRGANVQRPDTLLLLGGTAGHEPEAAALLQALQAVLQADGAPPVETVLLVQADRVAADALADRLGTLEIGDTNTILLLSQENSEADTETAVIQRLCREWLALPARPQPQVALHQVHHGAGRRLIRQGRVQPQPDSVCLIRKEWLATEALAQTTSVPRGAVLVLVNDDSLPIARQLLEPKDFQRIILVGDTSITGKKLQNVIDFADAKSAGIGARLLLDQYDDISHILDLSDLYAQVRERDGDHSGKTVFYQHLIADCTDVAILYITKGLQGFQAAQRSLAGARFAGLVKMLSAEYRHVDARCVDIDQQAYADPRELRQIILQEFQAQLLETELCYRQMHRFAARLTADSVPAGTAPLAVVASGVYVISGGTSGIGLEISRHLVRLGARRLVLMGVTPLPRRQDWRAAIDDDSLPRDLRDKLAALSALVPLLDDLQIYTGNLSDLPALQRYFRSIRSEQGPIKGIIHSAGVYSDAAVPSFVNKELGHMQQVWDAKITGLENLHTVFREDQPDFFVSFASVAGVVPQLARGASDLAMANAFTDFFMAYQEDQLRESRTQYRSIVWSDWNQAGALSRMGSDKRRVIQEKFQQFGLRTFSNSEGCALFEQAMQQAGTGSIFIGYVHAQRFARASALWLHARQEMPAPAPATLASSPVALVRHVERWEAERRAGLSVTAQSVADALGKEQIRHLDPALIARIHKLLFSGQEPAQQPHQQAPDLTLLIRQTVMEVLKLKQIDSQQPFQSYGLDSISAMVLATRLEKQLDREVQAQWLIDFCTVERLAAHLAAQARRLLQG